MEGKRNVTQLNEEKTGNLIDIGKQTQIGIYDNTGRILNLSVCKEDVKILKYIGDLKEELKIETAKLFSESDIDVYNASEPFFNDTIKNMS